MGEGAKPRGRGDRSSLCRVRRGSRKCGRVASFARPAGRPRPWPATIAHAARAMARTPTASSSGRASDVLKYRRPSSRRSELFQSRRAPRGRQRAGADARGVQSLSFVCGVGAGPTRGREAGSSAAEVSSTFVAKVGAISVAVRAEGRRPAGAAVRGAQSLSSFSPDRRVATPYGHSEPPGGHAELPGPRRVATPHPDGHIGLRHSGPPDVTPHAPVATPGCRVATPGEARSPPQTRRPTTIPDT